MVDAGGVLPQTIQRGLSPVEDKYSDCLLVAYIITTQLFVNHADGSGKARFEWKSEQSKPPENSTTLLGSP